MRIGLESGLDIDIRCELLEPRANRDASEYLVNNYDDIFKKVKAMGVPLGSITDLIHDVYVSFVNSENEGNGYDDSYDEEGYTSLEQFVFGRLKGYSKNARYHSDGVEQGGKITEVTSSESQIVSGYLNEAGELVTKQRKQKEKRKVSTCVYSASFEDTNEDSDSNDGFQTAYKMASTTDDLADVEESVSIREQLEFCIDFSDLHELKIMNILKNVDLLAETLPEASKRKKSPNSLFSRITEMVACNDEFADALKSVLVYSGKHRDEFQSLLANY